MNGFLVLGFACTAILVLAVVFDGLFDAFEFGPTWLSLPVIAAFLGAFGFGTGAVHGVLGPLAMLPGVAVGLVFAVLAVRLTTAMMGMPTGRTATEADLLGSLGRIVTAPQPGRYGEVLLDRPTGPLKVACTSPSSLPAGTEVVVVDVASSTLVTVQAFETTDHDHDTTGAPLP